MALSLKGKHSRQCLLLALVAMGVTFCIMMFGEVAPLNHQQMSPTVLFLANADTSEFFIWVKIDLSAACRGVASAHNGLGVLHFEGAGNAQVDNAAARDAFTRGAELGEPDAMFNLATLYSGK